MVDDLRPATHPDLDAIDVRIRRLFGLVRSGLAEATNALLTGDRVEAKRVMAADIQVDELAQQTDRLVQHEMELTSPPAPRREDGRAWGRGPHAPEEGGDGPPPAQRREDGRAWGRGPHAPEEGGDGAPPGPRNEVRFLLTAMRIVPQLERSADLVAHIAGLVSAGLVSAALRPEVRQLVADMAETASSMWEESARAWVEQDPTASDRLEDQDDEIDVVAEALTGKLGSEDVAIPTGMKLALLIRFYERLGDHAVHLARRIRYLVEGDEP